MDQAQLQEVFNKYQGKQIAVYTENDEVAVFPNSPIMAKIEQEAKENNLSVCLKLYAPGKMLNDLGRLNSVTVSAVPSQVPGKYVIHSVNVTGG